MMSLCVILSVKKLLIEPVVIRLGKEAARCDRAASFYVLIIEAA